MLFSVAIQFMICICFTDFLLFRSQGLSRVPGYFTHRRLTRKVSSGKLNLLIFDLRAFGPVDFGPVDNIAGNIGPTDIKPANILSQWLAWHLNLWHFTKKLTHGFLTQRYLIHRQIVKDLQLPATKLAQHIQYVFLVECLGATFFSSVTGDRSSGGDMPCILLAVKPHVMRFSWLRFD